MCSFFAHPINYSSEQSVLNLLACVLLASNATWCGRSTCSTKCLLHVAVITTEAVATHTIFLWSVNGLVHFAHNTAVFAYSLHWNFLAALMLPTAYRFWNSPSLVTWAWELCQRQNQADSQPSPPLPPVTRGLITTHKITASNAFCGSINSVGWVTGVVMCSVNIILQQS